MKDEHIADAVRHSVTSRTELGGLQVVRCTCGWTDYADDLNEARRFARGHIDG